MTQRSEPTLSEPIFNVPSAVMAVIAVCAFVYLAQNFYFTLDDNEEFLRTFAFVPARYHGSGLLDGEPLPGGWAANIWTFVTYAFIHANFLHLVVNMVWFLPFGSAVARRLGRVRFLLLFAVTAAAGAGAHLLTNTEAMIGASAAVSGCMAAATRFAFQRGGPLGLIRGGDEADYHVPAIPLLTALRDMRIVVFVVAWFGLNLVFGIGSIAIFGADQEPVAWQAHIGGFLAGLLLFPFFDPVVAAPRPAEREASEARETSDAREASEARDGNGGETPPTLH